jgi:PEP-CTERM motif-containing protein
MIRTVLVLIALSLALPLSVSAVETCTAIPTAISNLPPECRLTDKLFANISANVGGTDVSANITVQSLVLGDLEVGLLFDLPVSLPVVVSVDTPLILQYSVSVLDPVMAITDVHLGLTALAGAPAIGTVTETVQIGATNVAVLVADIDPATLGIADTAFAFLSTAGLLGDTLTVTKLVTSLNIDTVSQTVTQQRVPEPATLAMLGSAVVVLGAWVQRKKSRRRLN